MAVFDLEAVIKLNDSGFKTGLKNVGTTIGKFAAVTGKAMAAGGAAVATLATSAVRAYADYEQLAGGIRKLYGNMGLGLQEYADLQGETTDAIREEWKALETAQNTVIQNAKNAYATAGMSMNQYMETATQFSASLINSLGGDSVEAARLTDVAMSAISDNWNTFGGDFDSISNAFKAFSKQNYTLLDNLKLGYGGTKTEMERLIADANEYAKSIGEAGDLSIESFADIITAIDLVQQKQQIAGTTSREATETIQGSLNMTKAAWANLVTALGDSNADLSQYFGALVSSAEIAFGNILPVAEQALMGIGDLVANLAPVVGARLPELVSSLLPQLISAAGSLINGVIGALPGMVQVLWDAFVIAATQIGGYQIGSALINLETVVKESVGSVAEFISSKLGEIDIQAIFDGAADVINGVADAITWLSDNFGTILPIITGVSVAAAGLWAIFNGASIIGTVSGFITKASAAFKAFNAVLAANPIGLVITLVASLAAAFITAYNTSDEFRAKVDAAFNAVKTTAVNVFNSVKTFIINTWNSIVSGVTSAVNNVKSAISSGFSAAKSTVSSIWTSISSTISGVMDSVKSKVQSAINTVKNIVNFSWSLPHLKLPHFSVSGSFSLNPPSVPHLSVSWNRKALTEPFMFTEATLFGAGEAGDEVLYGKSNLLNDIRVASSEGNEIMVARMDAILAVIEQYLPEAVTRPVVLDSGRLVGGIGSAMNNELGDMDELGRRGVSFA